MPYSRLIDNFRSKLYAQHRTSLAVSLLKKISHNKTVNRWAHAGLGVYQASYWQKTARFLGLPKLLGLAQIDRLLPDHRPESFQAYYAASGEVKGAVGLFTGCMGSLLDRETVAAAIQLLTAAGYNVSLPEQQTCCGALDLHDGDRETAGRLEAINCNAFAGRDLAAIVTIASGCGGQLQEYKQRDFADKVVDISRFLSACDFGGRLTPLTAAVCLHTPCSLKNVMREEQGALKLLQQLPGITLAALPEATPCCGSAGSYMLRHPKMAQALLDDLLAEALKTKPDYLLSSNIGCALHIAAGLREQGINMEVLHPIVLIARQLRQTAPNSLL